MRCDRFDGFPCLTDGKADAHVLCVRPRAQASQRHAAHARQGGAARDRRAGRTVTAWSSTAAARGDLRRRHRRRARAAPPTLPRCCCARPATSTRTASPTPPAWSGRHYMAHLNSGVIAISQTPNDDEVPEDARGQRLLLGRRGLRPAARPHPDARQVRPQHPARRRAVVRARRRARLHGQARDRLLADDGGPPAPGQPRHRRPRRRHPPLQDLLQHRAAQAAAGASSRACSGRWAATRR